jgi:hypothetical protein
MPKRRGRDGAVYAKPPRFLGSCGPPSLTPSHVLALGLSFGGGAFMPARRRAGRLVDRVVGDVPPGWLSRPLGGVGRPVGFV